MFRSPPRSAQDVPEKNHGKKNMKNIEKCFKKTKIHKNKKMTKKENEEKENGEESRPKKNLKNKTFYLFSCLSFFIFCELGVLGWDGEA